MKTVQVEITGTTPLLMHSDNIDWADKMTAWKDDPKNKKFSKAGDDRTPPWRWIGCLYHDGNIITMPNENIMRCIMEGATQVFTGKGQKTFKAQSQSGLLCNDFHWPFIVNGKTILLKDIQDFIKFDTFKENIEAAECLDIELFVKRARIGQSKNIRVRPRFNAWSVSGQITIIDKQITPEILQTILEISGQYKGLGDWRPGAKTPGAFGMFKAVVR